MAARAVTGVILRRRDFNEFDRLLTIFTPEEGMVECLARGVRKITSKLGSKLQLFQWLRLQLAQNRGRWPTITGVDCLQSQSATTNPAQDFRRFSLLCALAEIAYLGHSGPTTDYDNVTDFAQFKEALGTLMTIGHDQSGNDLAILLHYAGRLLADLGYLALPLQCARCGQDGASLRYLTQGVMTCGPCGGQQTLTTSTTEALARILATPANQLTTAKIPDLAAATQLMKQLYEHHLDCRLRAWPLLTTLPLISPSPHTAPATITNANPL